MQQPPPPPPRGLYFKKGLLLYGPDAEGSLACAASDPIQPHHGECESWTEAARLDPMFTDNHRNIGTTRLMCPCMSTEPHTVV